nr:LLM class flavin-dependent oxidoreductase [Actinomadura fibrosa]
MRFVLHLPEPGGPDGDGLEPGPLRDAAVAPYRNPFPLAKAAATLDRLSGGRLTLGLGTGYQKSEFRALGWAWTSATPCSTRRWTSCRRTGAASRSATRDGTSAPGT